MNYQLENALRWICFQLNWIFKTWSELKAINLKTNNYDYDRGINRGKEMGYWVSMETMVQNAGLSYCDYCGSHTHRALSTCANSYCPNQPAWMTPDNAIG